MSTKKRNFGTDREADYDRLMLRSSFVSLFWSALQAKGMTMLALARKLRVDKSAVSRWFSGQPNWELDTVSDIANALDLDLTVMATDRKTRVTYTPAGPIQFQVKLTSASNPLRSIRFIRVEGAMPQPEKKVSGLPDAA